MLLVATPTLDELDILQIYPTLDTNYGILMQY